MITEETIWEDPLIIDLYLNRGLKEDTRKVYTQRITLYCKYTGLGPTELIEEAEEECDEGIKPRNRKVKKYLLKFREKLKAEGKSANYIKNCIGTVKTLYREYDIDLPHINRQDGEKGKPKNEILTKDDIKIMLGYANLKYRAIIKLMMGSGMGGAEIRNLRVQNLFEAFGLPIDGSFDMESAIKILREKDDKIGCWCVKRERLKNHWYFTYNSPEALEAVLDYLNWRETRHPIKSLDDYLFEAKGDRLSGNTMLHAFKDINEKSRLGYCDLGNSNPYHFGHPHAFRKFFATNVTDAKMRDIDSEWLLGHKIGDTKGRYKKSNKDRLKKEYLKVLPALSIAPVKTVTIESDEVKEIKKENKTLKEQMKIENDSLRAEIKEQEERHKAQMLEAMQAIQSMQRDFTSNAELDLSQFEINRNQREIQSIYMKHVDADKLSEEEKKRIKQLKAQLKGDIKSNEKRLAESSRKALQEIEELEKEDEERLKELAEMADDEFYEHLKNIGDEELIEKLKRLKG
jgi:integrase